MLSTDSSSMTNNCFGVLDKTSTSKYYILGSENLALILTHLFLLHYAMCFQSNLKPSQCVQAKGQILWWSAQYGMTAFGSRDSPASAAAAAHFRPTFVHSRGRVSWCIVHTALPNQYAYEPTTSVCFNGHTQSKRPLLLEKLARRRRRRMWPFWPCRPPPPGRLSSTLEYTAAEGYTNALGGGENRITPRIAKAAYYYQYCCCKGY